MKPRFNCESIQSIEARAEAEGINLIDESDKNLIRFYFKEVSTGDFDALTSNHRVAMKVYGLLERVHLSGYRLTDRGSRLLGEIMEENKIE